MRPTSLQRQLRRLRQLADSVSATARRAGDKLSRLRAMLEPRVGDLEATRITTEVDMLAEEHVRLAMEEESFSKDIR